MFSTKNTKDGCMAFTQCESNWITFQLFRLSASDVTYSPWYVNSMHTCCSHFFKGANGPLLSQLALVIFLNSDEVYQRPTKWEKERESVWEREAPKVPLVLSRSLGLFIFATSKGLCLLWCGSMLFKVQSEWKDVKLQGASVVCEEGSAEQQMKGPNRVW